MTQPLEQCVQQLCELVAHRTLNPGGDEETLCRYLATRLRSLGADEVSVSRVDRDSPTPAAYVYARFGNPTLLINIHLDTVPPNSGWQRDPFVAEVTEDRVYGLGTCDIKGAMAALLIAMAGVKPQNIGILFSGDEENASSCLPRFLANHKTSNISQAIVCEPTSRCAGIRHRGVLAYRAKFLGRGGHSSKADHLEKPLVQLSKLALILDDIALSHLDVGPKGMKGLCMNVAKMSGGIAYNVVPNECELQFSLRPGPDFDTEQFERQLEAARASLDKGICISPITRHGAFSCGDVEGIRELLGAHGKQFGGLDFWTEAALLQEAGIDTVVIGPGDIAQAHSADEFVTKSDLSWALDMFKEVIQRHAA